MVRSLASVVICLALVSVAAAGEIGFIEDFSLATDRTAALKQLIPGTEDYYYYHCLHFQNTEQFAKVDELLTPWVQRHGETPRVWEIRTRQALLTYDKNPRKSLDYLITRMGLNLGHQKENLGAEPNLPTALDQAIISREQFVQRANAIAPNSLDAYEDSALDWLTAVALNPNQRRNLLSRLNRPDHAGLVKTIADDLNHEHSGGFGSLVVHRHLLLAQLEELLKLKPELLNQQNFVQAYLARLQPGADEDWRHDTKLLEAHLDRLWAFAQRLAPVHNSLRAHVLYHRLMLDRQRGNLSKERFLTYLKLPRPVGYAAKAFLESDSVKRFPCDLNANYGGVTLLAPIGNDEPLVRSYLAHFLVDAANAKEFEPYINDVYLKHLFVEVKIVNGLGEPETWASQLPPELFQALKDRVDLDFAHTNKISFGADEAVKLDLHVKNVQTLLIKVFEINTQNFYREQLREIDTDINLDGLVPNEESTTNYREPALRRVTRTFAFPKLNRPGVYVIDFIGNGKSSRALVRKGRLRHVVRTGPAGQVFTVLDDQNREVNDATIWLGGHEYAAAKDGSITVPFSNAPGRQPIVISSGNLSSLDFFNHEGENYALVAGIYVDRESLLTRKKASVVIRPGMFLNGTPASVALLEEAKFTVTSTDLDGVATTQETPNFKLFEDRETVHEIQVPARTASISFTLAGKVKKLSAGGTKVDVSSSESFTLNEIDRSEKVEDLHLLRVPGGYVIEVLGKTGEPKVSRPVYFAIKHRDFKHPVNASLKTDARGRIALGALIDIAAVTATGPENTSHTWPLRADDHTYGQLLHGREGEPLTLPFLPLASSASGGREAPGNVNRAPDQPADAGRSPGLSRSELSLLELRGDNFVADRFDHLKLQNGLLVLDKLPAGDYDLLLKSSGRRIRVRVTAGAKLNDYVLGKARTLETKPLAPLQIAGIDTAADKVTVRLANASKFARVHVFATRFVPEYSAFGHLSRASDAEPYLFVPGTAETVYLTGRNIGDEYRYIIDRKLANKFPGNTLERPSLLLNPWAVRSTETGEQVAAGGDDFKRAGAPKPSEAARMESKSQEQQGVAGNFANLDFLAEATAVLLNLTPDKDGTITIKREALGLHQHIHVVAVDPINTTYRSVTLPEPKSLFVDLRLANALDAKAHFTQQKQITVVPAGQPFALADITTSKFEAYDSLARVYALYATLSHDPKLAEFSFLLGWPKLKPEEKRTLYSKHASHELSFFLARKDPEFYRTVIKPYLVNKKDKTFLDRWLLDEDLREFLLPWKHGQLNVAERVLLARKIAAERAATARHVSDLQNLLPPNIDGFIHLFDTAVKGSALDTSDVLGLAEQLSKAVELETLVVNGAVAATPADSPALLPPGAAGGMGGGFGGRGKAPASMSRAGTRQLEELRRSTERLDEAKKEMAGKDGMARKRDARLADMDGDRAAGDKAGAALAFRLGVENRDKEIRQLYRKLDKTMEWAENNYHHLTIDQQTADLIAVNAFWRDFAAHDPAQPFLSRNAAEASRNFAEMLLALAVLDLPFESPKHDTKFDGVKMTLTPAGPMIVYHEEIEPAKPADGPARILVSQNYFRHGERFTQENGEQIDKYVSDEFVIHTVYGCQVVVTNPTSARQKLGVLIQIPRGAIPVLNSQPTKTVYLNLEPYHTQTIDYHFYFPAAGSFPHFPVHVAKNDDLIAFAAPVTLNVVDKPTKIDTQSWDYISQHGSTNDVIAFLTKQNVHGINLERIAWRMRDAKVFDAVTKLLAARHAYQHTLWSYSMFHDVPAAAREFLQHADQIVNESGGQLVSPLLVIDPVARRTYEHLEYKPLVNARAHALGKRRQIVNDRFHQQYHRFLHELQYQRTLGDDDLMTVTHYLLLQDRIEESLATFARVNADKLATKLQYDYLAAYLDFFTDEHAKARGIAAKYADHPVDRWRNVFAAIVAQLDEAEGKAAKVADAEDRGQQQTQLAATEPNFDFQVEAKQIRLNHQNLDSVRVNFYLMDVELLFSRNPFVQQFRGQFSAIRPNHTEVVQLKQADAAGSTKILLPAALTNKNVLVEITGGGQTKSQAYYSHSLAVQVIENYGQIRVTHAATTKPVAKAYVKVYAQTSGGQVKFYKDGYTDVRGRFDYASLNTNDLDVATKFSILILSDDAGAVVREASPPKQ